MTELKHVERPEIFHQYIKYVIESKDRGFKDYKSYFTEDLDNEDKWEKQSIGMQFDFALHRAIVAISSKMPKKDILKYLHYAKDLGLLTLLTGSYTPEEQDDLPAKFQDGEFEVAGQKGTDRLQHFNARTWQDTLYLCIILEDESNIHWLTKYPKNQQLKEADTEKLIPEIDYMMKDFLSALYGLEFATTKEEFYEIAKVVREKHDLTDDKIENFKNSGIEIEEISNYIKYIKGSELQMYTAIEPDEKESYPFFTSRLQFGLETHFHYWNGDFGDDVVFFDTDRNITGKEWISLPLIAACIWNLNNRGQNQNPKFEPIVIKPTSDYLPHWLIYRDFEDDTNWK